MRVAAQLACLAALLGSFNAAQASSAAADGAEASQVDMGTATRFADLALQCLHNEYPNHISLDMDSDADARPPHLLTPAFYGCLDWHSDVHAHWLLVRLLELMPQAPFANQARAELSRSFTADNIAAEVAFMRRPGRASFERPYGMAWLLTLCAELRQWNDPLARQWSATLLPLEAEAASRIKSWLPRLRYPIRVGEHEQTAFSFSLIWDWAQVVGETELRGMLSEAAARFYLRDRQCPLAYEPSGEDFLSPCLAEADFMRRVLGPRNFGGWLSSFLPGIPRRATISWLPPAVITDRADAKLAHLDGLNLSRSWMLEGIARGLDANDRRVPALHAAARAHAAEALPNVTGEHYEGGHWLGAFAVYLLSGSAARM